MTLVLFILFGLVIVIMQQEMMLSAEFRASHGFFAIPCHVTSFQKIKAHTILLYILCSVFKVFGTIFHAFRDFVIALTEETSCLLFGVVLLGGSLGCECSRGCR